jgi:signal transduction histidine kinase
LADTAALANARDTPLELHAKTPMQVQGDRSALAALLRNLVDNALRYSPPQSQVVVSVTREGPTVCLAVDDSGTGLAEAERKRAFDRFWRRDAGVESGSGLGLAIVRSVAERHRATVALDASPLGGLRVSVAFAARGGAAP